MTERRTLVIDRSTVRARVMSELAEHRSVIDELGSLAPDIAHVARIVADTFEHGGKLLLCGNGGSAADAQHVAAEFIGRFERERAALPAIALTTDTSALTALSNDYAFEIVFARQVNALAAPGDCVVGVTTSGTSPNIVAALAAARTRQCRTIVLTGQGGARLASEADAAVIVPSARTARIQEAHILVWHIVAGLVEEHLAISLDRDGAIVLA
jgi:D-sedoheptulose 7-phosphate isomerase